MNESNSCLQKELYKIKGNDEEIRDRFYQYLSFGTGGMRGLLGAGTNRVNVHTIRLVSEGLALYVKDSGKDALRRGVVIAYDTRHFSKEFALESAKVLGKYNIQVYLFSESRPTPLLSFAIRHLHAFAGIVITASHNPSDYNGFKVYGEDGGQFSPKVASQIERMMKTNRDIFSIGTVDENKLLKTGTLHLILDEIDNAYHNKLRSLTKNSSIAKRCRKALSIVYTPLYGTGLFPLMKGLDSLGFQNVTIVEEQANEDPNFPTVRTPNPEDIETFELAMAVGSKINADLLIATDPDADRLGVVVRDKDGNYVQLTGNQIGALLLNYILLQKTYKEELPHNGVLLKSIVTSDMGRAIGSKFGIETVETLIGFKYISEKIEEYDQSGEYSFLFGYEESCGYLIEDFTREKDAVQAALLIAEIASYYKALGKTIHCILHELYEEFGYFLESVTSLQMVGEEGQLRIQHLMKSIRNEPLILPSLVIAIEDYYEQKCYYTCGKIEQLTLPKTNAIKFHLADDSWICVRPSGTEPTIKFYFGVKKETSKEASLSLINLEKEFMRHLRQCCTDVLLTN
jgi:phosphoglucomutase